MTCTLQGVTCHGEISLQLTSPSTTEVIASEISVKLQALKFQLDEISVPDLTLGLHETFANIAHAEVNHTKTRFLELDEGRSWSV